MKQIPHKISVTILTLLILQFFVLTTAYSQSELVLKNGIHKVILRNGHMLMPILKGDTNTYSNWKLACKACSSLANDSVWEIDSIAPNAKLYLKTLLSYKFDTLTPVRRDTFTHKELRVYKRNWELDTTIKLIRNKIQIYSRPESFAKKTIDLKNTESLRMAKYYFCSKTEKRLMFGVTSFCVAGFTYSLYETLRNPQNPLMYGSLGLFAIFSSITIHADLSKNVKTYNLKKWRFKIRS